MEGKEVSIWVKVRDGFTAELKRVMSMMASVASGVKSAFTTLADIGKKAFLAIGVGIAVALREYHEFNKAMTRAESMIGKGAIKALRRDVLDLSMAFGIAKVELAEGLYQALSAGVPQGNVIEFLKVAAKAAVVDGSNISVAVDGITTVLNAFKMKASEAGNVADLMFATVKNGKTTFNELSSSIAQVAPIAAAFGIGADEILAAVATLTKQGVPTSIAMTNIRASILSANQVLGDGWAKTMSYQDGMAKIAKQAGGSENKLTALVGRVESVNAVLGLTGDNAANAAADLDGLKSSAGVLDKELENGKAAQAWPTLWETIRVTVAEVGEGLQTLIAPAIGVVQDGFKRLVERMREFKDSAKFNEVAEALRKSVKSAGDWLSGGGWDQIPIYIEGYLKIALAHVKDWAGEVKQEIKNTFSLKPGRVASFVLRVPASTLKGVVPSAFEGKKGPNTVDAAREEMNVALEKAKKAAEARKAAEQEAAAASEQARAEQAAKELKEKELLEKNKLRFAETAKKQEQQNFEDLIKSKIAAGKKWLADARFNAAEAAKAEAVNKAVKQADEKRANDRREKVNAFLDAREAAFRNRSQAGIDAAKRAADAAMIRNRPETFLEKMKGFVSRKEEMQQAQKENKAAETRADKLNKRLEQAKGNLKLSKEDQKFITGIAETKKALAREAEMKKLAERRQKEMDDGLKNLAEIRTKIDAVLQASGGPN